MAPLAAGIAPGDCSPGPPRNQPWPLSAAHVSNDRQNNSRKPGDTHGTCHPPASLPAAVPSALHRRHTCPPAPPAVYRRHPCRPPPPRPHRRHPCQPLPTSVRPRPIVRL